MNERTLLSFHVAKKLKLNAFYLFNFIIKFISIVSGCGWTVRGSNSGWDEIFRTCQFGLWNTPI